MDESLKSFSNTLSRAVELVELTEELAKVGLYIGKVHKDEKGRRFIIQRGYIMFDNTISVWGKMIKKNGYVSLLDCKASIPMKE